MLVINLILLLVSCFVLVLSGSFLVKSLVKIASFLRLSEYVVAFIIMAFATSIPELFIGISSALAHNTALALGTVIGSNIADLTLVIGVAIVMSKYIKVKPKNRIRRDTLYMFALVILPLVLMYIGDGLSRSDGIVLLFVFIFYVYGMVKKRTKFTKEVENNVKRRNIVLYSMSFLISVALLYFSAKYVVKYANLLSIDLMFPPILVGLFLIAIGTSLPELVFEVKAVLSKHSEMALGNIIGSVIANSTLVLGVTALIYPITASYLLFIISGIFMMIITFLFMTFVQTSDQLHWKMGISLILLYVFFIMVEFYIKTLVGG